MVHLSIYGLPVNRNTLSFRCTWLLVITVTIFFFFYIFSLLKRKLNLKKLKLYRSLFHLIKTRSTPCSHLNFQEHMWVPLHWTYMLSRYRSSLPQFSHEVKERRAREASLHWCREPSRSSAFYLPVGNNLNYLNSLAKTLSSIKQYNIVGQHIRRSCATIAMNNWSYNTKVHKRPWMLCSHSTLHFSKRPTLRKMAKDSRWNSRYPQSIPQTKCGITNSKRNKLSKAGSFGNSALMLLTVLVPVYMGIITSFLTIPK